MFTASDAINVNVGGGTFAGAPNTGGYDGGGLSSTAVSGVIDEVRFSGTALTPAQFLTAVPEPTGAGLLLAVGAVGLLLRRRAARPD